jgi:hypothetical protein
MIKYSERNGDKHSPPLRSKVFTAVTILIMFFWIKSPVWTG